LSSPRFLADENVPLEAIRSLQADGHDVVPVVSVRPGAPDEEVLALGAAQQRVVITFDRKISGDMGFPGTQ
jgi:predicted nuclease of predicted toxin-antitoxin system